MAKSETQRREIGKSVMVTNRLTGHLPDMFLRIEIRAGWREKDDLHAGLLGNKVMDSLAFVPGSTIQEQ
jgi:hypothetical protein